MDFFKRPENSSKKCFAFWINGYKIEKRLNKMEGGDVSKSYGIKIDQSVLDYMDKKGKDVLTLDIILTGGGCCPTMEISEIEFRKPDKTDLYDVYEQNDITLYISKKAKITAPTLHFILKNKFIGSTIETEGISVKKQYSEW